jgi:hypothetical protein
VDTSGYCKVDPHRVRNCVVEICRKDGICKEVFVKERTLSRLEAYGITPIAKPPIGPWTFCEHDRLKRNCEQCNQPKEEPISTVVPTDAKERKNLPICTGVLDYFPDALLEVARCSKAGNDQHNPGQPLHWAKEKSTDEPDALVRHLIDRGRKDKDGIRHSAKVAWRALALLQREIEAERQAACESA